LSEANAIEEEDDETVVAVVVDDGKVACDICVHPNDKNCLM
jgi:hypothetical protein